MHNWAGNYQYRAQQVRVPETVAELQRIVRKAEHIKALGTRHSFNDIADTAGDGEQVSLERFREIEVDATGRSVTVGAGINYGELAIALQEGGYALHNLASLPHISVAGACATATHGSGCKNGNLATAVRAMELVTADGNVLAISQERDAAVFPGVVVNLGALGVVTRLTLAIEPAYRVRQTVHENLPFAELERNFDAIYGAGDSVSLFTTWQDDLATQVWVKRRCDEAGAEDQLQDQEQGQEGKQEDEARAAVTRSPPHAATPVTFFDATLATADLHPIAGVSSEHCTRQMGKPGPWHERLPHFRLDFTPSSGAELQSECFVGREHGFAAIRAVASLKDQITPHLWISELRTIAADELWMSPCYRRGSLAIHFTWKPDWPAVQQLLPLIEQRLKPFAPRPHWGKLFAMEGRVLQSRYERLAEFKALLDRFDPRGKFCNAFLQRTLFE